MSTQLSYDDVVELVSSNLKSILEDLRTVGEIGFVHDLSRGINPASNDVLFCATGLGGAFGRAAGLSREDAFRAKNEALAIVAEELGLIR